jgi:hypothetical protein
MGFCINEERLGALKTNYKITHGTEAYEASEASEG